MEVVLLILASAGVICFLVNQSLKNKSQLAELNSLLNQTLIEHERELEDHKAAELELTLLKSKLEVIQSSTLTPDNSIPKHIHVEKIIAMSEDLKRVQAELNDMTCKFEESRGKQRSEQVRLGLIGEQFATLHENFKYNRKETKALLQPIDFVCFEEDEVIFVDVKTGNAQLSTKQRKIRDNIRNGRVRFEVFRINENGANWED